jgi:hypothetical protein
VVVGGRKKVGEGDDRALRSNYHSDQVISDSLMASLSTATPDVLDQLKTGQLKLSIREMRKWCRKVIFR